MPLPGGPADKFGNSFEGRWTVWQLIDVLAERADSIRLEPPGDEGQGIEFWLRRGPDREYHQIKRQHGGEGRWTIASLSERGVLATFYTRLADSSSTCVFASAHSVRHLDELADDARRAASLTEFDREFLKAAPKRASFDQLRTYWENCSPQEAFDRLRRVVIHTSDEEFLRTVIETQVETLVEGASPAAIVAVLAQFALDQVHHELTALDIWRYLETVGYRRREWQNDPRVLAAVEAQNRRFVNVLQDEAIGGILFRREEAALASQKLVSPSSFQSLIFLGEAGIGKSSVMPEVMESLTTTGWVVLAFRVDRLESAGTPDQVGRELNLPGSPASVLAAIAQGRPGALFIDQLDAVSLASGRRTSFFECLNEIIKQALSYPNLRVVIGCRKFDIENDHRLRRLVARAEMESIPVKALSTTLVRQHVAALGLDDSRLTAKQIQLLAVPLHLSLLSEVADDAQALTFETAKDLYDRFWTRKQDVISARLGRDVQWSQVIDALSDHMNAHQGLSAPAQVLDPYSRDARAMVSEHVLRLDDDTFSFFHESFFDYAFARRFGSRGVRLVDFLLSDEQHLFRRAQVRQILLHERENDRSTYLIDLAATLFDRRIRFHVKSAIFGLLAAISDPKIDEWNVLAPALADPSHELYAEVWGLLYRAPTWFGVVDSAGLIEESLSDDTMPNRIDLTVNVLRGMQRHLPDRVADLLTPKMNASPEWNNRIAFVIQWSDVSLGTRFQQFMVRAIDLGVLDGVRGPVVRNSDFWDLSHDLPEKDPARAAEIIGHFYDRCVDQTLELKSSEESDSTLQLVASIFNTARNGHEDYFLKAASGAPREFVQNVLPVMLRIMELTAQRHHGPPWSDSVWCFRHYQEIFGSADALLQGMVKALSLLAVESPNEFTTHVTNLRTTEFETAHFLVIRAFAGNPAQFADEAVAFLSEETSRLRIGYMSDHHWPSRQLIQAISPHCSPTALSQLEDLLLSYYPPWELEPDRRASYGYGQFTLLDGIASAVRSPRVSRRLEELKRKFGTVTEPVDMVSGFVQSPIADESAAKMSDEQWLRAITQYHDDSLETKLSHPAFKGGAVELSRVLEAEAKKDPARFAALACRFPDDANVNYFEGVLRGVTDGGLELAAAHDLCIRCHALPDRPVGRWLVRLIESLAALPLSEELLQMLSFYATEDPDPDRELWRTPAGSGQVYFGGSIDMAALNSNRGAAALAVGAVINSDGARLDALLPTLERLVRDSSITVRAAVSRALIGVMRHDRSTAIRLFNALCETEDSLLRTEGVAQFLKANVATDYLTLEPIITRMINAADEDTNKAGARLACIAALFNPEAQALAQTCLSASEAHRKGAAQVYAANLGQARFRTYCEAQLLTLLNDPSPVVRREAARCFIAVKETLPEYASLIDSFVSSEAFAAEHRTLFHALDETPAQLPEITCAAGEKFFESVGTAAADISTHASAESFMVSKLVIRTYAQNHSAEIQRRCLDLIDRIVKLQAIGMNEAMADYER